MTTLTVISPAAESPLSLDAAKAFLRVGDAAEDSFISDLIQSARERMEQVAGLALVTQTVRVTWSDWPSSIQGRGARLPISPVRQLLSVTVRDADGASSLHADRFQILCGRIYLRPWSMLPPVPVGGRIEIDIEAGFGAAADLPEDLREALLHLIAAMYAARTPGAYDISTQGGLPDNVQAILNARKQVRL